MNDDVKQVENKNRLYYPRLDTLRFIAFLLVFFFHAWQYGLNSTVFNKILSIGWIGMDLFFVISSYLLTTLLIKEVEINKTVSIKKFFLRRILRIWPLYFLIIIVFLIFSVIQIIHQPTDLKSNTYLTGIQLIGYSTFTIDIITSLIPNFTHMVAGNFLGYIGNLWSISLEEKFYFLLPFLLPLVLKLKRKNVLKLGLFLLFILESLKIAMYTSSDAKTNSHLLYYSPLHFDAFILGAMLALGTFDFFFDRTNKFIVLVLAIGLYSLFLIISIPLLGRNELYIYTFVPVFLCLFFYIINNAKSRIVAIIFENKTITYLGKISFGLYVFHYPVILIYNRILASHLHFSSWTKYIIEFILCLAVTIVISILSYELFEKRFLKMKSKFTVVQNREI